MNYLITGGAGFIGSTIAKRLVNDDIEAKIYAYDSFKRNAFSDESVPLNIHLTTGDILDANNLKKFIQKVKPDYIIHCAAIAGINSVALKPVETFEINTLGTYNLLKAAKELVEEGIINVKRIILFSTSEVYGSNCSFRSENDPAVIGSCSEPRWIYATSKLACEHLGSSFASQFNLPIITLRPFNVFGGRQVGEGALSIFINAALKNSKIMLHDGGHQIRTWTYVDDMVESVICAMTKGNSKGGVYNIANASNTLSMYSLAHTVKRVLNSSCEIVSVPSNHADIRIRIPDVSLAKEELNFTAKHDLEPSISESAQYRIEANVA